MTRNDTQHDFTVPETLTPEALAELGSGHLAYVKPIMSEDAALLYPGAEDLRPGLKLFTLHAADGTPIMLSDSHEAVMANAWEHELIPVAVH